MRLIPLFLFLFSALITNLYGFAGISTGSGNDTISPIHVITSKSLIYSGTEYAKVYTSASGNPFFRDQPLNGWVDYYRNRYENIPISYDIESDQVIFHEPVNSIRIGLVNEKVSGFMIENHHFIPLNDATGFRGFYEAMFLGKRDVLVKWQKILTRTGTDEGRYIAYSNIYIREGSNLLQVSSKTELFNYFGSNKKKIQQYYHDQHLNLKKDPGNTVVAIVAFAEKNGY